jgi:hypothetical protein
MGTENTEKLGIAQRTEDPLDTKIEKALDRERLRMSCESRGAACTAFSTARKDFFSVLVGGLLN